MDPIFRAAGSPVFAAATVVDPTPLSPIKDATTVAGDLMICWTWSRSRTATVATPSGWTLLSGFPLASATASGGKLYAFYRVAAGGDNPSISWSGVTTGAAGDASGAVIISYANVGNASLLGDPTDATPVFSDLSAQTTTTVIPAITTATPRDLVLGFALKLSEVAGQTSTVATFTERVDAQTVSGTGHVMEASEKFQATAGSSGSATVTWSDATSARAIACSIALKSRVVLPAPAAAQSSARLDLVSGAYPVEVLSESPIMYLRMGHGAQDFSGFQRDGTAHAVTFATVVGAVDQDDGAGRFDGSTSYMDGFPVLPFGSAQITIECWLKTDDYAAAPSTMAVIGTSLTNGILGITTGGNISLVWNGLGGTSIWQNAWATIGNNRYAHLVIQYDPASAANTHLWLNGEDRGNPDSGGVGNFVSAGFPIIGATGSTPAAFFDGVIDEVAIYSGLMADNQVALHYRTGIKQRSPLFETLRLVGGAFLQVDYRMGEADLTQNKIYDSTVNARHGAITAGLGAVARKAAGGSLDTVDPYGTTFDGATAYATSDTLTPFGSGFARTFVMLIKRESISTDITNIFCGEGLWNPGVSDDMKLPVLEWCPGVSPAGHTIRWYGSVDRDFPIFMDWRVGISDTNWHLYVLRVDDSQTGAGNIAAALDLAIDGVPLGPPQLTVLGGRPITYKPYEATAGKFMFGVRHNVVGAQQANEYSNATYDEVAIINAWITDAQVKQLANAIGMFPVPLAQAAGQSSATLALGTGAKVFPSAAAGQSSASLTGLTTAKTVVLSAAAGQSSASLALKVPTQVPLSPAAGQSSASLALTVTAVPFLTMSAHGQSAASLALSAPVIGVAHLTLAAAHGQSFANLILVPAPKLIPRACVAAFHDEGPLPNVAAHFLGTSRMIKLTSPQGKPSVLYLPGGGGLETSWQGGTTTNPSEVGDVFRDCCDRGLWRRRVVTLPTDWTWGDAEMITRINAMLNYAEVHYGFVEPYHLVGVSMGTTCALNWATRNLDRVKSIALMLPAVDLQDIETNRAPAYPAVTPPSDAYGTSTIPNAYNPAHFAANFNGVTPIKMWYSPNDTICNAATVTAFASASGAIATNIGNQGGLIVGHGLDSGFVERQVHDFLIAHDA